MNEQQSITLNMLRTNVAELPEPHRKQVQQVAAQLRAIVHPNGDHGLLALALVSAETQVAAL